MVEPRRKKSKTTPPDDPLPPTKRPSRGSVSAKRGHQLLESADEISEDTRRLSTNPRAVKARLRKGGRKMAEDLAMLHEIQYGEYRPVSEWTYEELEHGRPKHPTGGWRGPKPSWITPIIQQEVARRLRTETIEKLNGQAGSAVKVLTDFLANEDEPQLRFKAAQLILEYTIGKPEQNVTVEGNVTLQTILGKALLIDENDRSLAHPTTFDGVATDVSDEEVDDDDQP